MDEIVIAELDANGCIAHEWDPISMKHHNAMAFLSPMERLVELVHILFDGRKKVRLTSFVKGEPNKSVTLSEPPMNWDDVMNKLR